MLILGLESSCDETSASVVEMDAEKRVIRSDIVASQIDVHRLYGGVVPEIASRAHIEAISGITRQALDKAGVTLSDIGAELLIISNFTLYADCRHGNRPDFLMAEAPAEANRLYEYFTDRMKTLSGCPTETGVFGADMKVSIENDGPVTLVIDSPELMKKKGGAG